MKKRLLLKSIWDVIKWTVLIIVGVAAFVGFCWLLSSNQVVGLICSGIFVFALAIKVRYHILNIQEESAEDAGEK